MWVDIYPCDDKWDRNDEPPHVYSIVCNAPNIIVYRATIRFTKVVIKLYLVKSNTRREIHDADSHRIKYDSLRYSDSRYVPNDITKSVLQIQESNNYVEWYSNGVNDIHVIDWLHSVQIDWNLSFKNEWEPDYIEH